MGQIFFSEQQGDPFGDGETAGLTKAKAQSKFEEFLRTYYRDSQGQQDYG